MKMFVLTNVYNRLAGFEIIDGKVKKIYPYEEKSLLGNIYVARVSNIVDNINAYFVDIKPNCSCYLAMEDCNVANVKTGDYITVQVTKDEIKTKKASVSTNISLTGDYVILQCKNEIGISAKITDKKERLRLKEIFCDVVSKNKDKLRSKTEFGCIIRTKASLVNETYFRDEIEKLLIKLDDCLYYSKSRSAYSLIYESKVSYIDDYRHLCVDSDYEFVTDNEEILSKINEQYNTNHKLYSDINISLNSLYGLNTFIDKCLAKKVYLNSGAYLVIEPTEAMTVIDVNTGKAIKGKDSEAHFHKVNLEAAKEIANQLMLRNISGIIMVDFINMKETKNNKELLSQFNDLLKQDSVKAQVVDMTSLGLVEVTRKKIQKPLHEFYS